MRTLLLLLNWNFVNAALAFWLAMEISALIHQELQRYNRRKSAVMPIQPSRVAKVLDQYNHTLTEGLITKLHEQFRPVYIFVIHRQMESDQVIVAQAIGASGRRLLDFEGITASWREFAKTLDSGIAYGALRQIRQHPFHSKPGNHLLLPLDNLNTWIVMKIMDTQEINVPRGIQSLASSLSA